MMMQLSLSIFVLHKHRFMLINAFLSSIREAAQKQYEEDKRVRREKQEYQREKMRENIRQKYGLEKKGNSKPDEKTIEVRKLI
jgi:hypothetical protein